MATMKSVMLTSPSSTWTVNPVNGTVFRKVNLPSNTSGDITVIRKVPVKIVNVSTGEGEMVKTICVSPMSEDTSSDDSCSVPRKRQRLDHLSVEEKVVRRKLKNRVAAQCARDRKKYQMQELEDQVSLLKEQNQLLEKENMKLQQHLAQVLQENMELQAKNSPVSVKSEVEDIIHTAEAVAASDPPTVDMPCEPAVFATTSLPQRWVAVQLLVTTSYLLTALSTLWMTSQWALLQTGCRSCRNSWKILGHQKEWKTRICPHLQPRMKWWGPQQRSWNPSKNWCDSITDTQANPEPSHFYPSILQRME